MAEAVDAAQHLDADAPCRLAEGHRPPGRPSTIGGCCHEEPQPRKGCAATSSLIASASSCVRWARSTWPRSTSLEEPLNELRASGFATHRGRPARVRHVPGLDRAAAAGALAASGAGRGASTSRSRSTRTARCTRDGAHRPAGPAAERARRAGVGSKRDRRHDPSQAGRGRRVVDAATDEARDAGGQRAAISNALVGLKKEFYGKGPTAAKTYFNDDWVFVGPRGRPDAQRGDAAGRPARSALVRQVRLRFQEAMTTTICGAVEEITGRRVLTYHSQVHLRPDAHASRCSCWRLCRTGSDT